MSNSDDDSDDYEMQNGTLAPTVGLPSDMRDKFPSASDVSESDVAVLTSILSYRKPSSMTVTEQCRFLQKLAGNQHMSGKTNLVLVLWRAIVENAGEKLGASPMPPWYVALTLALRPMECLSLIAWARSQGRVEVERRIHAAHDGFATYSTTVMARTQERHRNVVNRNAPYFSTDVQSYWELVTQKRTDTFADTMEEQPGEIEAPEWYDQRPIVPTARLTDGKTVHLITPAVADAMRCVVCHCKMLPKKPAQVLQCYCTAAVYCSADCARLDSVHSCQGPMIRIREVTGRLNQFHNLAVLSMNDLILPMHGIFAVCWMHIPTLYPELKTDDYSLMFAYQYLIRGCFDSTSGKSNDGMLSRLVSLKRSYPVHNGSFNKELTHCIDWQTGGKAGPWTKLNL